MAWHGKTKLTQQKHTFTSQRNVLQHKINTKKTKTRFSRLLQHAAWKWTGPILVLALHKLVTYLLETSTLTHLQLREPHGAAH